MRNTYFQFKQFTIQQDKCAMKVTTDGCLFGAIVANELSRKGACQVLDIGTGTGLLSLMIAQENTTTVIDAIEIDVAAAAQAKGNIAASPWSERVNIIQDDILNYELPDLYDVIFSNPPFYEQQLSSPVVGKQLAHHSSGLTLQQLFEQVKRMLKAGGKFYVLLPFYRRAEAIAIGERNGLSVKKEWLVKQTSKHPFFRTVIYFGRQSVPIESTVEITIRSNESHYTQAFTESLQPFYLHL